MKRKAKADPKPKDDGSQRILFNEVTASPAEIAVVAATLAKLQPSCDMYHGDGDEAREVSLAEEAVKEETWNIQSGDLAFKTVSLIADCHYARDNFNWAQRNKVAVAAEHVLSRSRLW